MHHLLMRLIVVMDRLQDTELNVIQATKEIYEYFGYDIKMQKAILDGSMGKYGVTYKLTTQVIGNWIFKSREIKKGVERL